MAHAKMEKELLEAVLKKKSKAPPRPPPPYVKKQATIPSDSGGTWTPSPPAVPRKKRPVTAPSFDDVGRSNSTSLKETATLQLSDMRRNRSQSSNCVFREDLEKCVSAPPLNDSVPGQPNTTARTSPKKPVKPPNKIPPKPASKPTVPPAPSKYDQSLSVPVSTGNTSLTASLPLQPTPPVPSKPRIPSPPSTHISPNASQQRKHLSSSSIGNGFPSSAPVTPSGERKILTKNTSKNGISNTNSLVRPTKGNYTKAIQLASSKSTNALNAPIVKVDLTTKSKDYSPRPAPPKPIHHRSSSSIIEMKATTPVYAEPTTPVYAEPTIGHHIINTGVPFEIEPYATCNAVPNDIGYVSMNPIKPPSPSPKPPSPSIFKPPSPSVKPPSPLAFQHSKVSDQPLSSNTYVISDLASSLEPSLDSSNAYMPLTFPDPTNSYHNDSDNSVYTDLHQPQQKHGGYQDDNVYSVPEPSAGVVVGTEDNNDGYLALSFRQDEASVYQDLDLSTRSS